MAGFLGTVEIDIGDNPGRQSSVAPTNTILTCWTGSATTGIVGVSGTRSLNVG